MMTATVLEPRMKPAVEAFFEALQAREIRTYREFATQDFILPEGVYEGELFSVDVMPFTGLILDLYMEYYTRYILVGPRQTCKTVVGYQIPTVYNLFECGYRVINGVPDKDMAWEIFKDRLYPVIEISKYARYYPTKGAGSRMGKANSINFLNNSQIRFLSKGISYNAPIIMLTEIEEMCKPLKVSRDRRETDPMGQIEQCASTYKKTGEARIFGEGIPTTKNGRIWRELKGGTEHQVWIPCTKCGEFMFPDRKHLVGWDIARDEKEAKAQTRYECHFCDYHMNDDERLDALQDPRLVARGQIVKNGEVMGDAPEVETASVHWNRIHSPFISLADFGLREWKTKDSGEPDDEKETCQYWWAIPYDDSLELNTGPELTREIILSRISDYPHGAVPTDTKKIIAAVDIGEWTHWYAVVAFNNKIQASIIDYGSIGLRQDAHRGTAIIEGLRNIRDNIFSKHWSDGTQEYILDACMCDCGHGDYDGEVYFFVHESGQGKFVAFKGKGTDPNELGWRLPKKAKHVHPGNNWYMALQNDRRTWLFLSHTDYWKLQVHNRLFAAPQSEGSISIYQPRGGDPREHTDFANQILAEEQELAQLDGRSGGFKTIWHQKRKRNHALDLLQMILAGADRFGLSLHKTKSKARPDNRASGSASKSGKKPGWKVGR